MKIVSKHKVIALCMIAVFTVILIEILRSTTEPDEPLTVHSALNKTDYVEKISQPQPATPESPSIQHDKIEMVLHADKGITPSSITTPTNESKTFIQVTVLGKDTGDPMKGIYVSLLREYRDGMISFGNRDEPKFKSPHAYTNENGVATLEVPNQYPIDEWIISARGGVIKGLSDIVVSNPKWSFRDELVKLKSGVVNEIEMTLSDPEPLIIELLDSDGYPLPDKTFTIGYKQWNISDGDGRYLYSEVTTDEYGLATMDAYPSQQMTLHIMSDENVLFQVNSEKSEMRNPLRFSYSPFIFGDDPKNYEKNTMVSLIMHENLVDMNVTIINAPKFPSYYDFQRLAFVKPQNSPHRCYQVISNQFQFKAIAGEEVKITFSFKDYIWWSPHEVIKTLERKSSIENLEHQVTVSLPEEPGEHELTITFPELTKSEVTVLTSEGKVISGVEVLVRISDPWPIEIDGSLTPPSDKSAGENFGASSSVKYNHAMPQRTDEDGRAFVEMIPGSGYHFSLNEKTLPNDQKGYDPIYVSREDLLANSQVTLRLKESSRVFGYVTDENGSPIKDTIIYLLLTGELPTPDVYQTKSDSNGYYELNLPPLKDGLYISPNFPRSYQVKWNLKDSKSFYLYTENKTRTGISNANFDQPDLPSNITMKKRSELFFSVFENGQPVKEIFHQHYFDLPNHDKPIRYNDHTVQKVGDNKFKFNSLLQGFSTITLRPKSGDESQAVIIPITTEMKSGEHYQIHLEYPDQLKLVEE